MPTVGPFYSYSQLEGLWIQNGGSPAAAPIAAAIAMAESSGGVGSYDDDTNGSVDRGLWQINSVHGALSTFDPNANAAAAVQLSRNGATWSPWTTFTSGAYQQYVQSGVTPSTNGVPAATSSATTTASSGGSPGSSVTNSSDPACLVGISTGGISLPVVGSLTDGLNFCFFSKTEARALIGGLLIIAGTTVTLIATVMIIKNTAIPAAAGQVISAASNVAKVRKVFK